MTGKKLLYRLIVLSLLLILAGVVGNGELTKLLKVPFSLAQTAGNAPTAEPEAVEEGHGDRYALVFEIFAFLLLAAMAGRFAANKLNQSPVLGELLVGILLGALLYQAGNPIVTTLRHFEEIEHTSQKVLNQNVGWQEALKETWQHKQLSWSAQDKIEKVALSPNFSEYLFLARVLQLFSGLGVIMLIFLVGLECRLEDMLSVGWSAASVAVLGVILPLLFGFLVTWLLLPDLPNFNVAIFMGATMCATSIGITARIFRDMKRMGTSEAKIVLGAAVLDDILGLIVLAAVTGIIASGALEISTLGFIVLKAIVFLGAVILFGKYLLGHQIAFFALLDRTNVKLLYPFCLLLILAWLADLMGLATIIGAFAAGLILKDESFDVYKKGHYGDRSVESVMAPLEGVFAPIFFVLMGVQVDISTFINPEVLLMGLAITLVAVMTKLAAALPLAKGYSKLVVGLGMVPRGEVGLIFASIGRVMGILDTSLYSVVIIMVLLTTLVTPLSLTWALKKSKKESEK